MRMVATAQTINNTEWHGNFVIKQMANESQDISVYVGSGLTCIGRVSYHWQLLKSFMTYRYKWLKSVVWVPIVQCRRVMSRRLFWMMAPTHGGNFKGGGGPSWLIFGNQEVFQLCLFSRMSEFRVSPKDISGGVFKYVRLILQISR